MSENRGKSGSGRRKALTITAVVVVAVALLAFFFGRDLAAELALRHYGSKVPVVRARGVAVKNYLKTLDTTLREGDPARLAALAPEALKPLPPCAEQPMPRLDREGVQAVRWEPAEAGGKCDPWKNIAAHWSGGAKIQYSLFKMLHLKTVDENRCQPEIRVAIQGVDSQGRVRQDGLYLRLDADFSAPLPVIADSEIQLAQSLLPAGGPFFVDEAAARGIDFQQPPVDLKDYDLALGFFPMTGAGLAVGDVDGDGWDDVLLVGVKPNTTRLYRNVEGRFTDITEQAGLVDPEDVGMAAAMGDLDNDGDLDVVITHGLSPTTLFRNRGDATFEREPFPALPGSKEEGATGVSLADVDNDGDLDVYVAYHAPASDAVPDTIFVGLNGVQDRLYINDGRGRFTEEAKSRGLAESRWTFQGAFADFDYDGDVDLYQVNDFGRKTLYENDGSGRFTDVTAKWPGTEAFGFGMSGCWGDYDTDGKLDLYVSGIASGVQWFAEESDVMRYYLLNSERSGYLPASQVKLLVDDLAPYVLGKNDLMESLPDARRHYFQGNILLQNRGQGFRDVSHDSGTFYAQWSWGSGFVDLQNDGLPDVYSTAGFISGKKLDDL